MNPPGAIRDGVKRMIDRSSSWIAGLLLAGMLAICFSGDSEAKPPRAPRPPQPQLVDIQEITPDIRVQMKYAGPDNFLKKKLYDSCRCLLVEDVARRLARVQEDVGRQGLHLKVWDCYRPRRVQYAMWEIVSDPAYVADPKEGSKHNRGAAVDVTLVDAQGRELDMGTDHDDFTPRAHQEAEGLSEEIQRNRKILDEAMHRQGFECIATEWWHFDAEGWKDHPLLDVPLGSIPGRLPPIRECDE